MKIYNATAYDNFGESLEKILVIYESKLLGKRPAERSEWNDLEIDWLKIDSEIIEKVPEGSNVCCDIELWTMNWYETQAQLHRNISKYKEIARYVKIKRPDLNFGHYNTHPLAYPPFLIKDENEAKENNDRINSELHYLNNFIDTIYAECYVRYNDLSLQYKYIDRLLQSAEQFNRPVVCFVSPRWIAPFDEGRKNGNLLSKDIISMVMDMIKDRGHDAAIWDANIAEAPENIKYFNL